MYIFIYVCARVRVYLNKFLFYLFVVQILIAKGRSRSILPMLVTVFIDHPPDSKIHSYLSRA